VVHDDPLDGRTNPDVDTVPFQFLVHQVDQPVRPPLEREHAFRHEVGKHDPVGDGRILECRAVGVDDRFMSSRTTSSRPGKNRSNSCCVVSV